MKRAGNRTGREAKRRRRRHERRVAAKRPVSGYHHSFASVVMSIGGVPLVPFEQFSFSDEPAEI